MAYICCRIQILILIWTTNIIGCIVICRTFHAAWSDSDSIPTAMYGNGIEIEIGIGIGIRLCECAYVIQTHGIGPKTLFCVSRTFHVCEFMHSHSQSNSHRSYPTFMRKDNNLYFCTHFCCFFCEDFSCSSSLIRCCRWTRPVASNTRHWVRSCGSTLLTVCCSWWSFRVTTTSSSFNFCCFSSYKGKRVWNYKHAYEEKTMTLVTYLVFQSIKQYKIFLPEVHYKFYFTIFSICSLPVPYKIMLVVIIFIVEQW